MTRPEIINYTHFVHRVCYKTSVIRFTFGFSLNVLLPSLGIVKRIWMGIYCMVNMYVVIPVCVSCVWICTCLKVATVLSGMEIKALCREVLLSFHRLTVAANILLPLSSFLCSVHSSALHFLLISAPPLPPISCSLFSSLLQSLISILHSALYVCLLCQLSSLASGIPQSTAIWPQPCSIGTVLWFLLFVTTYNHSPLPVLRRFLPFFSLSR